MGFRLREKTRKKTKRESSLENPGPCVLLSFAAVYGVIRDEAGHQGSGHVRHQPVQVNRKLLKDFLPFLGRFLVVFLEVGALYHLRDRGALLLHVYTHCVDLNST